ncbi:hypothetical protein SDC9_189696 [bioreactor metagenome]|uniref:Uncharacterized protein n=1 Tax=bioreactor metagenome TaxID=1076179 RepID=A0A645HTF5_9ZZZZ
MDPAVQTSLVEDLPGLRLDGLALEDAAHLDALPEPPDDPIGPGRVEDVGEVFRALALQVVQMPLAGQDLILAALAPELSPGDLFGVDRYGVMEPRLPPSRHKDRCPDQWRQPPPASEPGARARWA